MGCFLHQDRPALLTGLQQKLGRVRRSKLKGQLGPLHVRLWPQDLPLSLNCPESLPKVGRGELQHDSHQPWGELTCPPSSLHVLTGPRPCSSRCLWDNVAFAIQLDGFSGGRENQEVIVFS